MITDVVDSVDTCCFNGVVEYNQSRSSGTHVMRGRVTAENSAAAMNEGKGSRVMASSNPSHSSFRVSILSNSNEQVSLQVWDVLGRVMEARSGVSANQVLELGSGYRLGMYLVDVCREIEERRSS